MVYIVVEYPSGYSDYATERVFNNKIKAYEYCKNMANCHGGEIEIELYKAYNEYTVERDLIKKY